ncbi:hypothetical protein [Paenibacillus alvei]|nr:hypothetical protein [Paenibacillus alvei]
MNTLRNTEQRLSGIAGSGVFSKGFVTLINVKKVNPVTAIADIQLNH